MPRLGHLQLCFVVLLASAGIGPAFGMCVTTGQAFFETEVVSCEPVRPRFDVAASRELVEETTGKLYLEREGAKHLANRNSFGAVLQRQGTARLEAFYERCDSMVPDAENTALLMVKPLRYKIVPLYLKPGEWIDWKPAYPEAARELIYPVPASVACADLDPGEPLTIEVMGGCCDTFPTRAITCYLGLRSARKVTAKAVANEVAEARIRAAVNEEWEVRQGYPRRWGADASLRTDWRKKPF
jgi:hypothetical protein